MSNSTKGMWIGSANEFGAGKALLAILLACVMMFTFGGLSATAGGPPESGMGINQFYVENGADRVAFEPVRLHLDATDATEMRFSNDGATWSDWEPYQSTKYPWFLDVGKGTKYVHAKIKTTSGGEETTFAQTYVQYWDDRIPIFQATDASDINSRIAVHPYDSNTLCVVWERVAGAHMVLLSCSTDNGVTWTVPNFVSQLGEDARNPDVAIGGIGPLDTKIHIVWEQYYSVTGYWQVFYSRWSLTSQELPPWIIDSRPFDQNHARIVSGCPIAMMPVLHVVMEEQNSGIVYLQNMAGGMGFWFRGVPSISASTFAKHPAIAVWGDFVTGDIVHVVFENGFTPLNVAYVQSGLCGNNPWTTEYVPSSSAANQRRPDVAAFGDAVEDVVHVVWDEPSSGFERIMYARNPDNGIDPNQWETPVVLPLPTSGSPTSASTSPTIDASSEHVAVAWQSDEMGHWEVYSALHYDRGDSVISPWERWSRVTFAGYHALDAMAPALALGIQSTPQVNLVWQDKVGYFWTIAYKDDVTERGEPPSYGPIGDLAIEIAMSQGPSDVYASTYQDDIDMRVGTYAPDDPDGEFWNRHTLTEAIGTSSYYELEAVYHLTIPHAEGHEDGSGTSYHLTISASTTATDTFEVYYGFTENGPWRSPIVIIDSSFVSASPPIPASEIGHHGDLWIMIDDVDGVDSVQDTLTIWCTEVEDIDGAIWLYASFPAGYAKTDLRLTWTPSADDLILDRYDIYMANEYHDSYYIRVGSVPTNNPSPEFRLRGGAIAGSPEIFVWENVPVRYPGTAYFTVVGRDTDGRTAPLITERVGKFSIDLPAEWVLLSLPLVTPSTSTPEVFAPIEGHWERVLWYDASTDTWKEYNVDNPLKRDLLNVDRTMGLWLELTSDGSGYLNTGRFTVVGDLPDTTQISLHWTGSDTWNLVGYPYLTVEYHDPFGPMTVEEALVGVCYNKVETYEPGAYYPKYYLKQLSDTDYMLPGLGYWIWVSCSDTWTLDNSLLTENLI